MQSVTPRAVSVKPATGRADAGNCTATRGLVLGAPGTPAQGEALAQPSRLSPLASLGNTAKSVNAVPARRLEKWELQAAARFVLPSGRVARCLHTLQHSLHTFVPVLHNVRQDRFSYSNLQTCGSVWVCPICATKISEHRRGELVQAVASWRSGGGEVLLLTLTAPHYFHQNIKTVTKGIGNAAKHFFNSRGFKAVSESIGLVGRIRALEVTYGENGWHPHFHLLLFVKSGCQITNIEAQLLDLWKTSCVKSSLPEPNRHGLTLGNGDLAAQYVGKWGIEHELTKGHIKQARGGYSPFDLLRILISTYSGGCPLALDFSTAAGLFVQYAETFKGKRQLVWSAGLRRRLLGDLPELSDDEIAEQVDQDAELFAEIPLPTWKIIRGRGLRGHVLEVARQGKAKLLTYLSSLESSP